uniref:Uncharacterized protein n=1 Tax=Arundo donax TaxID=35708 RepID=A0A0A9D0X7_ARUDO
MTLQAYSFMPLLSGRRELYLVDSVKNGVRGGVPIGIDHLPEDDRHEHPRHAAAQRPNCAGQHQHDVRAVGILEQPVEWHLGHRRRRLAVLLLSSTRSCHGAILSHVDLPGRLVLLARCLWLQWLCGDRVAVVVPLSC